MSDSRNRSLAPALGNGPEAPAPAQAAPGGADAVRAQLRKAADALAAADLLLGLNWSTSSLGREDR